MSAPAEIAVNKLAALVRLTRLGVLATSIELAANLLTVVGGLIGLYAIVYPETIATYLERISSDVSVVADSIPRWPVIHGVSFDVQKPTNATFTVEIANPRNIVVKDFVASAILILPSGSQQYVMEGANLIPPNEDVILEKNVIRMPWFPEMEALETVQMKLCFGGRLEGDRKPFFETREYELSSNSGNLALVSREFSSDRDKSCE